MARLRGRCDLREHEGFFDAYVPRVASAWDEESPGSLWRTVEGSLLFVDVSGFTNLSERLARKGRIGAEELTFVLNTIFGRMLDIVSERGGSLIKFGGDALLLLFDSEDHVLQASAAAVEMRNALSEASKTPTSVGRINLKMSSGIHSGLIDFFLLGDSHRELIVTGPTASVTTNMEGSADAGEIVVSEAVKRILPNSFVGAPKGDGWLLRKRKIHHEPCGQPPRRPAPSDVLESFIPTALRSHLSAGLSDPEHRIATIGFLKFKGVDSFLARSGPERLAAELDNLIRIVQKSTEGEDVTFLASDIDADGGKVILATGIPRAQHDDEGRMLRAARTILDSDRDLEVRIGVNRGHVFAGNVGSSFRRTFTVMGDTVNLAARLMTAAGSGELYSSPSVLNLSSTLFKTEALEPFHVKGKEMPVQAFSVWEEAGVRPPVLSSELPFTGREAELQMLVGIVDTCARVGRGGVMTITGDTGVGKSRLIAEVLERCGGMDTLMIQAEPAGTDNPYWAFRDPLRRRVGIERASQAQMSERLAEVIDDQAPDLAWALPLIGDVVHIDIEDNETTRAIDAQFRPSRTADALIELLSAGNTKPVALVVEDGQWLDEASEALLSKIEEAAKTRPWTILVTARTEGDFQPMGDEIALGPLDDEAMHSIVVEATAATPLRPHELANVVSKADGNPLFLGEILRVVAETGSAEALPDSLDAVISTEIDTLPALPRQLLRYSSVLGRRFRRVVLSEYLEPEDFHLDAATEKELSRFLEEEEEGRLAFRHNVVRDIAYESLSYSKRRELHERAGDVIERQAEADPNAVAEYLSFHYSASGQYEKAWQYAKVAADKARHAYANSEAATQYRRALEAARWIDVDDVEKAELQRLLGDVLDRLGAYEDALTTYRRAQRANPDPEGQAWLLWVQGNVLKAMGEFTRALATLTRGLKLARAARADDVASRLLAERAAIRFFQGRYKDVIALAQDALTTVGPGKVSSAVALAELLLDGAEFQLGVAEDHSASWRALHIAEELNDLRMQANALNNLGNFAYFEGDWDEAARLFARGSEVNHKAGDEVTAAFMEGNLAEIRCEQGHLDEAEAILSEVIAVSRAAGETRTLAFALSFQGRVHMRRGDIASALQYFEEALETYDNIGAATERIEVMLRRAEALAIAQRGEDAMETLKASSNLRPEAAPPQLRSLAYRARGLAAWAAGNVENSRPDLEAALSSARELESKVDELAAIHALVSTGEIDPELVDRAVELCLQLGVISVPVSHRHRDEATSLT